MPEKKIKVPAELQIEATIKGCNGELADLEGNVRTCFSEGGITKWKFVRAKGGWQYMGNLHRDLAFKQKGYSVIQDASEDAEEKGALLKAKVDSIQEGVHRLEQEQQDLKAVVASSWNYTMLSIDNRVLKIGETRWNKEPSELKAELEKRYRQKKERAKGGPFRYISHKPGTDKTEAAALTWLDKCEVKPLYGEEYFPSHEALKALRAYGSWCLGEWGTEGGFLPHIEEIDQGELSMDIDQIDPST